MNRMRVVTLLGLWLLAPCVATGQQMNEDIEVMRRLLIDHLQSQAIASSLRGPFAGFHVDAQSYDQLRNPTGMGRDTSRSLLLSGLTALEFEQFPKLHGGADLVSGEGLALKGQGVVFSLTMPPGGDPKAGSDKPADKPLTDWERMLQEVRGTRKGTPPAPPRPPSLADVVLRLLADNGKHFTQLADGESLTVAITFRERDRPVTGTGMGGRSGGLPGMMGGIGSGFGSAGGAGEGGGSGAGGEGAFSPPLSGGGPSVGPGSGGSPFGGAGSPMANPTSARDYELLGDLHARQGNWKNAIEAYEQGVTRTTKSKELASLYQKLAAAHLANGAADAAVLKKAMDWLKKSQDETAKAATWKPDDEMPLSALPARLIITASKKLLDQVGGGKMSFEEFKKAATVEHHPAPEAGKKSGSN